MTVTAPPETTRNIATIFEGSVFNGTGFVQKLNAKRTQCFIQRIAYKDWWCQFFVEDFVLKIFVSIIYTPSEVVTMNQIPKKCSPFGNPEIPKLQHHHGFQNPKLSGNSNLLKNFPKKNKTNSPNYPSKINLWKSHLVGGWTKPSEKYDRQNGFIFPKLGVKWINAWNHHLVILSHLDASCGIAQIPVMHRTISRFMPITTTASVFWIAETFKSLGVFW